MLFLMGSDSPEVEAGPGELCTLEVHMLQECLQMLFGVHVLDMESCHRQRPALLATAQVRHACI